MVTKFASLATASALLLTAAPAAVADTSTGSVQFSFISTTGSLFRLEHTLDDTTYEVETGIFAEFESGNVQMSIETNFLQGNLNGLIYLLPGEKLDSVMTIIIEDVPNYGPMEIELNLFIHSYGGFPAQTMWEGEFAGSYGPPAGFGEPATFAGNWTAQVVPAPGVASLLALTGLARRRRRD
jgi:hypothetical protein